MTKLLMTNKNIRPSVGLWFLKIPWDAILTGRVFDYIFVNLY